MKHQQSRDTEAGKAIERHLKWEKIKDLALQTILFIYVTLFLIVFITTFYPFFYLFFLYLRGKPLIFLNWLRGYMIKIWHIKIFIKISFRKGGKTRNAHSIFIIFIALKFLYILFMERIGWNILCICLCYLWIVILLAHFPNLLLK